MVSRRDKHCLWLCASGAEVAEPTQRATELARRRGICSYAALGARAIVHLEADLGAWPWALGAISPGWAAAGGGHGPRPACREGERAFRALPVAF